MSSRDPWQMPRRNRPRRRAVAPLSAAQRAARDQVEEGLLTGRLPTEAAHCPGCGRDYDGILIAERERHGLPMQVVACSGCGLVYNDPRLAGAGLQRYYDDHAYKLDRGTVPRDAFFDLEREKGRVIMQVLEQEGVSDFDGVVADIGCGAGGVVDCFRMHGYKALGCDLSDDSLELGRNRGLELIQGDLEALIAVLEDRGESIGLAIYEQVLEHLPDPRGELERLRRALPDHALLYVGVPGLRNVDSHYRSDLLLYLEIDHLVHFDLASLRSIVEPAGFRMVYGDEQVRALFRPAVPSAAAAGNGPEAILGFLSAMERRRRRRAPRDRALAAVRRLVNLPRSVRAVIAARGR